MLPSGRAERRAEIPAHMAATFWDVVVTFFRKPNIYVLLIFILLYRAGEGQVVRMGRLFCSTSAASADSGWPPAR